MMLFLTMQKVLSLQVSKLEAFLSGMSVSYQIRQLTALMGPRRSARAAPIVGSNTHDGCPCRQSILLTCPQNFRKYAKLTQLDLADCQMQRPPAPAERAYQHPLLQMQTVGLPLPMPLVGVRLMCHAYRLTRQSQHFLIRALHFLGVPLLP